MSEPFGWSHARLGDILEVKSGFAFKSSDFCAEGVPVIRQGDLQQDFVDTRHASRVPGHFIDDYPHFIIEEGDLLIGMSGSLGKIALYKESFPALQNQRTGLLRFPGYLSPSFVRLALKYVEPQIRAQGKGIAVQNVSATDIESCRFPCPPLQEQYRIMDEVEKQFTRLDDAVAALKRVQANLKRYRASVLKAACAGRLVPTEAELARKEGRSYEPASKLLNRILAERRAKWEADQLQKMIAADKLPKNEDWKTRYKEPKPPNASMLTELPEGWIWATVEQISTKVVDGVHKKPDYVPSGVPFVTVKNLTAGPGISFDDLHYVTKTDHEEFTKRANPELGDILISKDGTLGVVRAIRTDQVFSIFVSVAMIKPVFRELTDYLEMALCSPQVQIQMVPKGSGLQHIHLEDLREDCIPLPPLGEQQRLVDACSRQISIIDALEEEVEKRSVHASALRQSILRAAFSGKLVPQDPTDEPASVLLARIRAERATLAKQRKSQGDTGSRDRQRTAP